MDRPEIRGVYLSQLRVTRVAEKNMKPEQILSICGKTGVSDQILLRSYLDSMAKIEDAVLQKRLLNELLHRHSQLAVRVDSLLRNTLPPSVADEITYRGSFAPKEYDCTILFSDFEAFTPLVERTDPTTLIRTLHEIFSRFDHITTLWNGTKVKTMGDAYMSVFGAPERFTGHAERAVRAGLAMLSELRDFNRELSVDLRMRVGINTGRVVAGVVGTQRMQFDVFGDDVNVAARFESSGAAGRVNVSESTHEQVRGLFRFEERGMVAVKDKGDMRAFFVLEGLQEDLDERT